MSCINYNSIFFPLNSKYLKIILAFLWSKLPVGSSANIIFGLLINALDIAILCDSLKAPMDSDLFYVVPTFLAFAASFSATSLFCVTENLDR